MPYLDVTASAIQVQVHVLDLAKLSKLVLQALLVRLFVDVGDDDDPAFNRADCRGLGMGLHFGLVAGGGR